MEKNLNLLIIQTAFVGDIALTVFFANEIKQMFPSATVHFISTKIGCEILKCFGFIDNPIVFDKRKSHKSFIKIKKFANEINSNFSKNSKCQEIAGQAHNTGNCHTAQLNCHSALDAESPDNKIEKFDYIFALHRSFRTAILTKFLNAKNKIGFDKNSLSFLLSKKIQYKKNQHEVQRNRNCLTIFENYNEIFDYENLQNSIVSNFKNSDNLGTVKDFTTEKKKYILVAAGSVWATKRWLKEYFAELCKKIISDLKIDVYLIGSEEEKEICDFISRESKAISLAGKTTIPQILELVRNSLLVITNDSAPTHFASIFNIPTVTIYGATSPSFGFYPLAENSKIIEPQNLFCHPCAIHGGPNCPQKNFDCMKNIKPEMVFEEVKKMLNFT